MNPTKSLLTLLLSLLISVAAHATSLETTLATCVTCHGSKGEGNTTLFAPALAGQRVEYLARQLRAFKAGVRGEHPGDTHGATMRGIASGLSLETIGELASYFSALPATVTPYSGSGKASEGNELYIATCSACHGLRAEGYSQLQSPSLRVLASDYLHRQMKSYVNGWRGASPHAEQPAIWMNSIANQILDDTQLAHIVAYIATLSK
jgi:cytochrome c oxidase subunit 2